MHGSRRAILKASVALIAIGAGGGMVAACSNEAPPPAAAAVDPNPVVATTYGKVKGVIEDGVATFKGVRYGADTATTRFQAPRAPEPWTDVKDALGFANSAPQPVSGDGGGLFKSWRPDPPIAASEDCLFLNVWTPEADTKKRPVLVWFHGGGFATGSGSSYAYDGVRLAKRGDVVVVTTNHRLNQFGYLNLAAYGEQFADSGAVGALDMEELEQEAIGVVRGHERAAPLAAHQDVLGHQFVDGTPQGADRHPQRRRQQHCVHTGAISLHRLHDSYSAVEKPVVRNIRTIHTGSSSGSKSGSSASGRSSSCSACFARCSCSSGTRIRRSKAEIPPSTDEMNRSATKGWHPARVSRTTA
jgi:hypothetical protein